MRRYITFAIVAAWLLACAFWTAMNNADVRALSDRTVERVERTLREARRMLTTTWKTGPSTTEQVTTPREKDADGGWETLESWNVRHDEAVRFRKQIHPEVP